MARSDQTPLVTELQYFEAHRANWAAKHPQKYVAIHGTDVIGFYDDFERALEGALRKHRMGEFLIKQIFEKEPVYAIF